ncbi:hypothetical protein LguiA_022722 [Lonicera macranthoides]
MSSPHMLKLKATLTFILRITKLTPNRSMIRVFHIQMIHITISKKHSPFGITQTPIKPLPHALTQFLPSVITTRTSKIRKTTLKNKIIKLLSYTKINVVTPNLSFAYLTMLKSPSQASKIGLIDVKHYHKSLRSTFKHFP